MPAAVGGPSRPSDPIGAEIVAGCFPDEQVLGDYERVEAEFALNADEWEAGAEALRIARGTLSNVYEGPSAEARDEQLALITRNHNALPQNSMAHALGTNQLVSIGRSLQAKLVEIVAHERSIVEAYCHAGYYQLAHMELYTVARGKAAAVTQEAITEAQAVLARVEARQLPLVPARLGESGQTTPLGSGWKASPVDHRTSGSGDDPGVRSSTSESTDSVNGQGRENGSKDDPGHRAGDGDTTAGTGERASGDDPGYKSSDPDITTSRSGGPRAIGGPRSPGGGPGMGSLGSGLGGGSGGGSGMPGSDLAGGLGHGLGSGSGSGMSGFDPSHLASAHDGGSGSAGFTSLSSGTGGSGGSVPPPVRPPLIPAAPAPAATPAAQAAPPPPVSPASGSASPAAAGGFGRASAAAGGFVAGPAAMSGPANVGAAPTASPGLAQGSPAGLASAGAAGAGAAAQPLGLTPAAMNSETPEGRIDEFGLAAVEAVKSLAPAVSPYPGLLLAAASVTDRDGPPFIVVTTNEGAGWLPPGFFLPRTMFHAQSELGSIEFSNRWYGWADPARILVDYAKVAGLQVRGLASMGAISDDTTAAWGPEGIHRITGGPKAVPSVKADQGARPLTDDGRGRFVHRLGVALPEFYRNLRAFWADRQPVVSVQAALEAWSQILVLDCATPLRRAHGAWALIESRGGLGRGGLTTDEWASLRREYESGSAMCGALRPGFRSDSTPGSGYDSAYGRQFRELRAMEALLWFEDGGEGDPADVVYTAAVVGASLDDIRTR